jgi:hypothetical protein
LQYGFSEPNFYDNFKCPILTAVLQESEMLNMMKKVPIPTDPKTFSAIPSKTKAMAML